jgi:ferredoxin
MDLTTRVKQLALNNDVDYVGIAPVDRFEHAPQGHKPTDLLPGAKSVVSMGIRISLGPQLSQRIALANKELRHVGFSYRWFGYGMLNMHFLDRAAFVVTRVLQGEGYVAVPVVASGVEDIRNMIAAFSHRHAAVAAGIGELGWNTVCITPDWGPRVRFVSVITTAELEPDPMYHGPKLCDVDRCRELGGGVPICVKVCPLRLFSTDDGDELVIGDISFRYAKFNRMRCGAVGVGLAKGVLGLKDIPIPKEYDFDAFFQGVGQTHPQQVVEGWVYGRGHYCGLCILRCPVAASATLDNVMREFYQE